jgi:c-di-GMP-binding flagellar brake protein YcgR
VLRVNGRLIISVHKDEQIEQYPSRIEEVTTVNMVIAMPISKGYPIILTPGSLFNVRLVDNGSMYSFRCTFLDKRLQPFPVWIVSLPTEIIKIQQRAFVRIDSRLPVDIVCLEGAEAIDDSAVLPAWTKDISGGGLQLIVQTRIKIGDRLQLTFQLPESLPIHAIGEVIRIHQPHPERELFWVGVNFTEIQEKDRTRIVRYIFQKQLECRRRGFKETR